MQGFCTSIPLSFFSPLIYICFVGAYVCQNVLIYGIMGENETSTQFLVLQAALLKSPPFSLPHLCLWGGDLLNRVCSFFSLQHMRQANGPRHSFLKYVIHTVLS